MRMTRTVLGLTLALLPLKASADDFQWEGRLQAGQTLEIKGINGGIAAGAASGAGARVEAVKRSRRGDADAVRIEVVEHDQGVTICAVYPGHRNECAPGKGGRMENNDNDTSVEFTVQVPAGVKFVGRTVNGGIEARGLDSDAEAYTVNGSIKLSASGHLQAKTVNGSIVAAMGRANWTGDLDFTTVNGSITLDLPDGLSADVDASTVNGSIETDFPIKVTGKFSRRRASGTIGAGGRSLDLETVNGSIRLKKAS